VSSDAVVHLAGSLLVALALGLLVGYLNPPTRPLVRKWGWTVAAVSLVALGGLLAALVTRPRGAPRPGQGSPVIDTAASARALQQLGDQALAHQADADADLARERLAAQSKDPRGAAVSQYDVDLSKARSIADPVARRRALSALVGRIQ
jgi:hypothetical protein